MNSKRIRLNSAELSIINQLLSKAKLAAEAIPRSSVNFSQKDKIILTILTLQKKLR